MSKKGSKRLPLIIAGGLVTVALMATPASANHEYNVVAPIVTFVALGWLLNHQQHQNHYQVQGHYSQRYQQHYKPRRHSYSHGGYQKPRRQHYRY